MVNKVDGYDEDMIIIVLICILTSLFGFQDNHPRHLNSLLNLFNFSLVLEILEFDFLCSFQLN